MITEDYCSYEVAKLLKEKGFEGDGGDCECHMFYHEMTDRIMPIMEIGLISDYDNVYFAPTHQTAMKWLREKHDILTVVSITYEKERYDWYICGIKGSPWEKKLFHEEKDITYNTYEEAVEAALKYCLENLI